MTDKSSNPDSKSKDKPKSKAANKELPTEELQKIQKRFRDHMRNQPKDELETLKEQNRRRWLLLRGAALCAIVFTAVLYTWHMVREGEKPIDTDPPERLKKVPQFDGDVVLLPGLTEKKGAVFPKLSVYSSEVDVFVGVAQKMQSEASVAYKLPIEVTNSVGMRFRLIPSGSFQMGSPVEEPGRSEDEVFHQVFIKQPFYMGKFEVTQADWKAVMGADNNPSFFKEGEHSDRRPVEEVKWTMCKEFTEKLCEKEGLPAGSYRMPFEMEWEYACRANTFSAYYYGNDPKRLPEFAVFLHNHYGPTTVGTKLPNAWGLYDMHGNVWEWCANGFYEYGDRRNRDKIQKSIRGGHWKAEPVDCRSAARFRYPYPSNGNLLGFRVIRVIPKDALKRSISPE